MSVGSDETWHTPPSSCFAFATSLVSPRFSRNHRLLLPATFRLDEKSVTVLRPPQFATGLFVAPPGVPSVVSFALVELLVHVRMFDNIQCVTAAPSASGFSRTLLLFLLLESRTGCSCNRLLLGQRGASRASESITSATLLSCSSIPPSYRF